MSMGRSEDSNLVQVDNKKLERRLLRSKIEKMLMKFTYSDLTSDTIACVFDMEPAEIEHILHKLKQPLNKLSVVSLLSRKIGVYSVKELHNMDSLLQLYRIAFVSKLKTWTPINLLDPEEDLVCHKNLQKIIINIRQAFRIKGLDAVVNVITHEDLIWVMIIEKKLTRKKGIKLLTPIFFCYEVGTHYIFAASSIRPQIIQCILKAMQYKKHKVLNLQGKNIKSLLALLKNKAMNSNTASLVKYEPAEAEVGHRYIDYTKRKARNSYVHNIFNTNDPILLENFNVKVEGEWCVNSVVPEMVREPFVVSMQLSSSNVIDMIKDMVTNDMFATPLPEYVQAILTSAKNNIIMRAPKTHNTSF